MGNCTITIHVTGSHHNKKYERDINRMAVRFTDELKAAGHSVEASSVTYGGREDLLFPAGTTRSGYYDKD